MSGPQPRPGILDIAPYVPGDSKAEGILEPMKLASNESSLGPSPRAIAAYRAMAEKLHRYPDGASADLRGAIAKHHGLDRERVVCGNGSDELIALLTKAYAGPGDEVLFTEHAFAMYPIATLAAGAKPVVAKEKGLRADIDALIAKVTDRTRIVFQANPNNPTGSYLTKDEIERLHRALPARVLLVIDAAYAEYVTRNDYTAGTELAEKAPNVVMTRTFSKIYGMAGARLGLAIGHPALLERLAVFGGDNVPAGASLLAARASLEDAQLVGQRKARNARLRDETIAWLKGRGFTCTASHSNCFMIDVKRPAEQVIEQLAAQNVLVGRVWKDWPHWVRVTVGNPQEMQRFREAFAAQV